jgi:hypothetical protein
MHHTYVEKHANEFTYIVITRTLVYIRERRFYTVPSTLHILLTHHTENLGIYICSHTLQVVINYLVLKHTHTGVCTLSVDYYYNTCQPN